MAPVAHSSLHPKGRLTGFNETSSMNNFSACVATTALASAFPGLLARRRRVTMKNWCPSANGDPYRVTEALICMCLPTKLSTSSSSTKTKWTRLAAIEPLLINSSSTPLSPPISCHNSHDAKGRTSRLVFYSLCPVKKKKKKVHTTCSYLHEI